MRAFESASYVWTPTHSDLRGGHVDRWCSPRIDDASTAAVGSLRRIRRGLAIVRAAGLLGFCDERGFRGIILDEPLINYRVRAGSGYRRSIQPEAYVARLRHFYDKHRAAIEQHALELIQARRPFSSVSGIRPHPGIANRSLEAELARLRQDIAAAVRSAIQGLSRVDMGDLRRFTYQSRTGAAIGEIVDRHYIEGFLDTHRADVRGRVLEVRDSGLHARFGGDA